MVTLGGLWRIIDCARDVTGVLHVQRKQFNLNYTIIVFTES